MQKQQIVIPFPVWDFLSAKQEEIAELLEKEFGVKYAPCGTPRRIVFSKVPPVGDEEDRLKIKTWSPGQYVTAIIGAYESSFGTHWYLEYYKASWSTPIGKCKLETRGPEEAELLEVVAHGRKDLLNDLKKVVEIEVQTEP